MLGISLLFIGAVLIINGIGLLNQTNNKESAPFNLLIGILVLIINLLNLYRSNTITDFFSVAGGLLFAFTYIYLAIIQWFSLKGTGLGWYCLFVAINALVFSYFSHDIRISIMWILWSSLWFLFFISLGLGKTLKILPYYTIGIGFLTCWIPGILILTHLW